MKAPVTEPGAWDAAVQEFERNGFVVVPNALSASQVRDLNVAFDGYVHGFAQEWSHFSDSFIHTADVLPRVADTCTTLVLVIPGRPNGPRFLRACTPR